MAKSRFELHRILCDILGSRNVYFQPPESIKIKYPAIIYSRTNLKNVFADNLPYKQSIAYQITIIDEDPDSIIVEKFYKLPLCQFNRHFTSDNLNHDVFTLYY